MDTKKITSRQLFALTAFFTCGTTILYISSGLAGYAKQDAWIAAAITPVVGTAFLRLYTYLGSLYPDKTLVEVIISLFGKWVGGLFTLSFIVLCFVNVPQVTWYVGNFVTQSMSNMPMLVINAFVLAAAVIGLFYGIEAIGRSSEILIPAVSVMVILTFALVSPNIKIGYILPVFENGVTPVLKGSLLLLSYTTWPLIVLNMICPPLLSDLKTARKSFYRGYLWGSFIIFLCTIMAVLVLGSSVSESSVFPTFLIAQEISAGPLVTRMEEIIAIVWIITLFFKSVLYFYGGVLSLSQLLGLKDHKRIILPLSLIFLVLSVIVYPNTVYENEWDLVTWVPFIASFSVVLPVTLLIGAVIRKRKTKNSNQAV
jgi:spore germination protein KB